VETSFVEKLVAPVDTSPLMRRLPWIIMVALAVWGLIHAVGAYLYNYNPWRGIVVAGAMGLFILWWAWLLHLHARRERSRKQ
jgi:hypothetical protein